MTQLDHIERASNPLGAEDTTTEAWQERLIGDLLARGLVRRDAAMAAMREYKVTGDGVGAILVRNGFLAYRDLVETILRLNPERIITEQASRSRIPAELLDQHSIIIAAETAEDLFISTMGDERVAMAVAAAYYPDRRIRPVAFFPDRVDEFVDRMARVGEETGLGDETAKEEVLDRLIRQAISAGASDVHVLPRMKSYTVMLRLLGVRQIVHEGSIDEYLTLVAQAKDRARMDLAERRVPQDGGFQIEHDNKLVDLRVATVPGADGELVIIRILDPDRARPRLDDLGITRLEHWRRGVGNMHGLCLICGPTGSGKTTTLNASIREMDRFGKSIYTVEDPVEYRIPYTGQVSVNTATGLDFSRAVRAFMRADPDVIILGEVRDADTARNAVKAADTGHLVLATLHTGSIFGAMSRLRDLEVPPQELRFLLRAVLVQSLVRTVCEDCGGTGSAADGKACRHCYGSGYAGRTLVTECASFMDPEEVDAAIAGKGSWPSMAEDAYGKMRQGITTEAELLRVLGTQAARLIERGRGGSG